MSETKLLSCQFCGTSLTNEKPSKIYIHEKTGCILDLRGFTEEDFEKWNTRKPLDRILERLEEIADKSNDMILESDSPQYYDGFEDGVRKAIEIIKKEVQHD